MLTVAQVLDQLRHDDAFLRNVTRWHVEPPKPAVYVDFPQSVPPLLREALNKRGIHKLYCHQAEVFAGRRTGENVTVVTPTASGKTSVIIYRCWRGP